MGTNKQWDRLKTEWNATLTIADLAEEIEDPRAEQTYESIAVRELERGFPLAVQSLVSLAIHAEDPRVRRGAANDVVNHNLALMQARADNNPKADRLLAFMEGVTEKERKEIAESIPPPVGSPPRAKALPDEPDTDPTEWLGLDRED